MSDYPPLLDELPKDMGDTPSKDGLHSHIRRDARSKRALRRQRARNRKNQTDDSDSCLIATDGLRGIRKAYQPPPPPQPDTQQPPCCDSNSFRQLAGATPEKCTVSGQELHENKGLEQTERFKNRDLCSRPIWMNRHLVTHETEIYAALDLGTNNCRLLIATPTKSGHFRAIDRFSRIVRLGEGITTCCNLTDAAMERTLEALDICRAKLSRWPVRHQRLIATEACRLAANGHEFLERVRHQLGLELEIVSRETETRLAVAGCSALVEQETEALVLFDIGGGSSEIALVDISGYRSSRLADHIIAWTSLPVGVVTLAERFGGTHVNRHDFACMKAYVKSLIDQFHGRDSLGDLVYSPSFHLLGTSGTMTTLAGIHLGLERYDRRQIDGIWMCSEDVTRMTQRLLSWDMEQRMANPCIGTERADLVLAGCAILEAIRSHWPSRRLRVADRGLREGILMELMAC